MTRPAAGARFDAARLPGALARAASVAAAAVAPALAAPEATVTAVRVSLLIGAGVGLAVLLEYAARTPALVDFRFAPPLNRMRFAVACLALAGATLAAATPVGGALDAAAHALAEALGGTASPVDLAVGAVTRGSAPGPDPELRAAATLALLAAWAGALPAAGVVMFGPWPVRRFDPWTNLPTFEPAEGADAPARLRRTAVLALLTALALPATLAVVGAGVAQVFAADALKGQLPTIWATAIWAAAPPVVLLRAVALLKLARVAEREPA